MASHAGSKLWSCASLNLGIDDVAARSATLSDAEMQREIEDCIAGGSPTLVDFWLDVHVLKTSGHSSCVRRSWKLP